MEKKITNKRPDRSVLTFIIRGIANNIRNIYWFVLKHRWMTKKGLVRIPMNVEIWSPHHDVTFGSNVQFGYNCVINCDIQFGSDVLCAHSVAFVGRTDHEYNIPGCTMWNSHRDDTVKTIVGNDVWVGHAATILGGITLGDGCIIGAGSVVTHDVPPCEIWAGNPARKIRDRFQTVADKNKHLAFLQTL